MNNVDRILAMHKEEVRARKRAQLGAALTAEDIDTSKKAQVARVDVPLMCVERGAKGKELSKQFSKMDVVPLTVTLTEREIHIAFADRTGPAFALDLNAIVKAAVAEIKTLLGLQKKGAS